MPAGALCPQEREGGWATGVRARWGRGGPGGGVGLTGGGGRGRVAQSPAPRSLATRAGPGLTGRGAEQGGQQRQAEARRGVGQHAAADPPGRESGRERSRSADSPGRARRALSFPGLQTQPPAGDPPPGSPGAPRPTPDPAQSAHGHSIPCSGSGSAPGTAPPRRTHPAPSTCATGVVRGRVSCRGAVGASGEERARRVRAPRT